MELVDSDRLSRISIPLVNVGKCRIKKNAKREEWLIFNIVSSGLKSQSLSF